MKQLHLNKKYLQKIVRQALQEDVATDDITAALIPKTKQANAHILTRENAILCGTDFVSEVFRQLNPKIKIDWLAQDGDAISPNQILCWLKGLARDLLTGERTALNFLQTLSATATYTHRFVTAIVGTKTRILDTRKTIPGLRLAQKYAVACGGGKNHRFGLYDAFLIKENHIAAMQGNIKKAVQAARKSHPQKILEVEVRNLKEFKEALLAKPDIIMLDNFALKTIQQAVKINNNQSKLEVSGNVNLSNVRNLAKTGVDFISIGALTKNIQAIDLSLLFED